MTINENLIMQIVFDTELSLVLDIYIVFST